jgi:hypothetical protein
MTYISFKFGRKGGLEVRTVEGVRGHIARKRGGCFRAVLTRQFELDELECVCAYVKWRNTAEEYNRL